MVRRNLTVDTLLEETDKWRAELEALRAIVLECKLTETVKWGKPCYRFGKANLVILYGLKDSCAMGFMKGALLEDARGILLKPGENSQSGRWIKFTDLSQIRKMKPVLKAYIREAIDAEKAGLKVDFKPGRELVYPEELQRKLDDDATFRQAFEALTPGRRRGYNLYFSAARQSKTRESRIEKCVTKILAGKGMHDR